VANASEEPTLQTDKPLSVVIALLVGSRKTRTSAATHQRRLARARSLNE
jgi:hypothetical protein